MDQENALVVFQGIQIRRTWYDGEWYFSVVDVVGALADSANPSDYLKKVRKRDEVLSKGWGQIVTPLKIDTPGGPQRINCANTENVFRIIQSVPSPKAEPFKRWLARVGYERIQEIENPELAQERAKEYYELKGYPKEWIEKRLRGIAVRQELTDEWDQRGVEEQMEYAILTNEISKSTFGVPIKRHKQMKGLDPKFKNQNLRDHMTDLELIFTMLGEASTAEITKTRNSQGFEECIDSSKEGGKIAGNARWELERKTGKKVVSSENYLEITGKVKKLENKKKHKR
ncbi:MAG: phage antirepressor protein [Candidatus Altiarchaeales archaeon WOR_SM1_79]|nr:MAG: phage antirepressor protein [Candidatus Altiarchaeales archaeon WOR_SM1_79]